MTEADEGPSGLREPPHSVGAEQAVIGGLLFDNDAIERIGDLRAEHFYRFDHRLIFDAIVKLITANERADLVTVYEALNPSGRVERLLPYLNEMVAGVPSSAGIRRHAEIVVDRASRRAIIAACDELTEQAFDPGEEVRAMVDKAGAVIDRIAQAPTAASMPVLAADEILKHLDVVDARRDGVVRVLSSGFGDLDRRLNGGFRRGQLVVVAARPKMGKTAFALQVARYVSGGEGDVALVLSMEMPKSELHDRNLSAVAHVDLDHIMSARGLPEDEWPAMIAAAQEIASLRLYHDDQGGLRLFDVRRKARQVKRKHGLDLLVIDYLQLMAGEGQNRNAEIEGITRGLKALAKELDVAIVLLSQLNRKLEERPNKRPMPSDLRDSGSIEQDADIVLFLYRDEVYNPDTTDRSICEVNVGLSRSGAPGIVPLMFIGHQVRFDSHAGPWQRPLSSTAPKRVRRSVMGDDD